MLLCPWDFPGQEHWSGLPFPSPGQYQEAQTTKFPQQLKPNHLLPTWQLTLDYVRCPFPSLGVRSVEAGWTMGTATVEVGDSDYMFML